MKLETNIILVINGMKLIWISQTTTQYNIQNRILLYINNKKINIIPISFT